MGMIDNGSHWRPTISQACATGVRTLLAVKQEMLAKTSLTAEELDRLVGRSVDEVKSNYAGRYRPLALVTAGSSSAAEACAIQFVYTSSLIPRPCRRRHPGANAAGRGYAFLANSASPMRSRRQMSNLPFRAGARMLGHMQRIEATHS